MSTVVPDPVLEERLKQLEPPYRSRGEAQVGRLLDRYGIPFLYEHPLLLLNQDRYQLWHPDFTLLQEPFLIIEYAGMPDVPEYMAKLQQKQGIYQANEIPVLYLYPDDLQGPNWPERVAAMARSYSDRQSPEGRAP